MTDVSSQQQVDSPSGTGFYPEGAAVDKLVLITTSGEEVDLKLQMVELNYYEDIYSFAVSGSVSLRDGQALVELYQLCGNEFLDIEFGRAKDADENNSRKFRVYKLGKRTDIGNLNSEVLTLHFCSEELIISEQTKVSKATQGQEIHKIIANILLKDMKVTKQIQVEKTKGMYDFVIPRLKPFEAISWLSLYARPETQKLEGADMLFFENKNGFNFTSLRSMYSQTEYATFNYQQNNTESTEAQKARAVIQFEFIKSFDMLNEISSGTYANKLISVDPLTRSYKVTTFNYDDYISGSNKPMNGASVLQDSKNRLGKTQSTSADSVVKVIIGNSQQYLVDYIGQKPGAIAKDIYVENFVPNRTAQIGLANHTVVKIVVPGDPKIVAGSTIRFNIYSLRTKNDTKELDKYYSGKYLVSAVRHVLQSNGVYQSILEIVKESYETALSPVSETSDLKAAVNE